MPDGTEDVSKKKYDNNYSRFDSIEEEIAKPQAEDRDWYYDSTGQRRQINRQPAATGSQVPGSGPEADSAPAVKKGFLGNAKKPLYGPEGSTQTKVAPTEDELFKQLGNLMGEDTSFIDGGATPDSGPGGYPRQASQSNTSPITAKTHERKSPDFKLTETVDGLQLVVFVPELRCMEGVDLDVTERKASLDFPSGIGLRPLHVELPVTVVSTGVRAKFSKKTGEIRVTLPTARS